MAGDRLAVRASPTDAGAPWPWSTLSVVLAVPRARRMRIPCPEGPSCAAARTLCLPPGVEEEGDPDRLAASVFDCEDMRLR